MTTQELILVLFIVVPLVAVMVLRSINPLTEKLAPRVTIEVNPNHFTFLAGDQSFELEPYLYVNRNDHKIVSISEEIPDNIVQEHALLRVNLFKSENTAPDDLDKGPLLEAFLIYGIYAVKSRLWFSRFSLIRPIVIFRSISTLDSTLCGYQKGLLSSLLQGETLQTIFE